MTATVAFCIEQTLGHRAHTSNIKRALTNDPGVTIREIPFPERRRRMRAPWALSASHAARANLKRGAWDVAFLHTQSVALFAPWLTRRSPYVVSVDATPIQLDTMGGQYNHRRLPGVVEQTKRSWYRAVFRRASHLVAWSGWAADSLVHDYGMARGDISIVHPGATQSFFDIPRGGAEPAGRPLRVLFVGGDFERKGGRDLLDVAGALGPSVELCILTESDIPVEPGVRVVRGATPGSPELLAAFSEANVFCLPTLGDCTPVVIAEAMAAGLPVITTDVGSNASIVHDQETGFIVPPGDRGALAAALRTMADDPARRQAMGDGARRIATGHMHADQNARTLLTLARDCIA